MKAIKVTLVLLKPLDGNVVIGKCSAASNTLHQSRLLIARGFLLLSLPLHFTPRNVKLKLCHELTHSNLFLLHLHHALALNVLTKRAELFQSLLIKFLQQLLTLAIVLHEQVFFRLIVVS